MWQGHASEAKSITDADKLRGVLHTLYRPPYTWQPNTTLSLDLDPAAFRYIKY